MEVGHTATIIIPERTEVPSSLLVSNTDWQCSTDIIFHVLAVKVKGGAKSNTSEFFLSKVNGNDEPRTAVDECKQVRSIEIAIKAGDRRMYTGCLMCRRNATLPTTPYNARRPTRTPMRSLRRPPVGWCDGDIAIPRDDMPELTLPASRPQLARMRRRKIIILHATVCRRATKVRPMLLRHA